MDYRSVNNTLKHHGIKGQKWGVRRFQNPDGTLTPDGRERYGINSNKDSDKLAEASANHYKAAIQKLSLEQNLENGTVDLDLKALNEYNRINKNVKKAEKYLSKVANKLGNKYVSIATESYLADDGMMYAKSLLTDKFGSTHISMVAFAQVTQKKEPKSTQFDDSDDEKVIDSIYSDMEKDAKFMNKVKKAEERGATEDEIQDLWDNEFIKRYNEVTD